MNFRPCVVIPVYNHKDTIAVTVGRLTQFQLPLFLVDDGSNAATRAVLTTLAEQTPDVRVIHLNVNQGKGAAVMAGLKTAQAAGYTHALQIDADGQHDLADVPTFLATAHQYPERVICGKPVYDDSVPVMRHYGRYLTHFWVWIETLSFEIADSMCGFRVYPLAVTCDIINTSNIPQRMDFDTAIVVHLNWRGVRCINLPTRVIYPPGGLSHFNMLRDNWLIFKLHWRLVFGMLCRLPGLLRRRLTGPQP